VSSLLPAQAGYTAAGLAYNAISLFEARHGRPPLTRGPAAINAGIFVLYATALVLGAFGFTTGYRIAIAVFVVLLGYGGVVVHLRRGPTDFYRGKPPGFAPLPSTASASRSTSPAWSPGRDRLPPTLRYIHRRRLPPLRQAEP
jgi:hypothetical protein